MQRLHARLGHGDVGVFDQLQQKHALRSTLQQYRYLRLLRSRKALKDAGARAYFFPRF